VQSIRPDIHDLPVKGLIDTSFIDWKGCLSTVAFTAGCNFRCPFCHNGDLVAGSDSLANVPLSFVIAHFRRYKDWLDRLVVTGGEPTIHPALEPFLERMKGIGIKIKLDTNGSNPDLLQRLVAKGLVDFIAMDVKGPLKDYDRWCGTPVRKGRIEESIAFIRQGSVDYEFRMTVVPFFHKERDVYEVAAYLQGAARFYIQEFRPTRTLNPAFAHIRPFSPDTLTRIKRNAAELSRIRIEPSASTT
jgi:pyruvate formate lyase activating enzyme